MDTFLPPIEHPKGIAMKLIYYFTRRSFGKVLTPLKVHSVRLPVAFGMFYGKISQLDKKATLSGELIMLIRHQVSRLNICAFCIDIGKAMAIKTGHYNEAKFAALHHYRESDLLSPAEKAALDYSTELTVNKQVASETFQKLRSHFTERQICELVYVVASEHVYNLTNIGLNIHSDMICDVTRGGR